MSHRQILERRELSLVPGIDWHSRGLQERVIRFAVAREADSLQVATLINGGHGEPLSFCIQEQVRSLAGTKAGEMVNPPSAELIGATGLLADLALHQVRSGDRSAAEKGKRDSSHAQVPSLALVVEPDIGSQLSLRSGRPVAIAPGESPHLESAPSPMEVLFAELASRRLRNFVTRKGP